MNNFVSIFASIGIFNILTTVLGTAIGAIIVVFIKSQFIKNNLDTDEQTIKILNENIDAKDRIILTKDDIIKQKIDENEKLKEENHAILVTYGKAISNMPITN